MVTSVLHGRSPRLVGWVLRVFVWLVESWLFFPIRKVLERGNNIPQTLAETDVAEAPLFAPIHELPVSHSLSKVLDSEDACTKANLASSTPGQCCRLCS